MKAFVFSTVFIASSLTDGNKSIFKPIGLEEFHAKCEGNNLEAGIYRTMRSLLGNYENQLEIRKEFPKPSIERRNTGYAVDMLPERNTVSIVIMLLKFRLKFCHVDVRRAFRFTSFATDAKIHDVFYFGMVKTIDLRGIGEKLPENIGPGSCCIFLIPCGHKRRAHRTA